MAKGDDPLSRRKDEIKNGEGEREREREIHVIIMSEQNIKDYIILIGSLSRKWNSNDIITRGRFFFTIRGFQVKTKIHCR